MADPSGQLGSWLSGLLALVYFPQSSSFVVRAISGMFVVLGIALIFPTVVLIAFDVALWIWRLYSLGRNGQLEQQQQQQQQQQQPQQPQQLQQLQQLQQQPQSTTDTADSSTDSQLRQRARLAA